MEPDHFLLLKGLKRIIERPFENNKDLNFTVSLARFMLQVDATPTSSSVTSFALGVPEFEQVAHQDAGRKKKSDGEKAKELRMKRFEEEEGQKGYGKGKEKGGEKIRRRCRSVDSFLQIKAVEGVRSVDSHMSRRMRREDVGVVGQSIIFPICVPRKSDSSNEGSPPKLKSSVLDLLEEARANTMLKTLMSTPASSTTSRTHKLEGEERNEVVEKLQEQLNSLRQKSFKVYRLAHGGQHGLIAS